jgi:two-component system sensor histidine kinase DesK
VSVRTTGAGGRGTVSDVTSTTAPSATGSVPRRGMPRSGAVMGIVWVVFLAEPFTASLDAPGTALRVVGVLGVLGVGVVFAAMILRLRRRGVPDRRTSWLLLAVQVACVALTCLAAQEHGLVGLVFVCVTAIYSVGARAALVIVAGSIVVMLVLPRVLPGWAPEDGNVLATVLASVAVFGFTQVIDSNRRLRAAQRELADLAVAQERERISRDMHDVLGHSLTVISVKAELAARMLAVAGVAPSDAGPAGRAATEVGDIQDLARGALADVRGMVAGSRRTSLVGELAAARSAFDAAGVAVELPGAADVVPAEHRELFAWVLREGTTNVLRHSGASHVVVTMDARRLVVDDDGVGAGEDDGATTGGHGLTGLVARGRAAGAVVETGPSPLGGFRLAVTVRDRERSADARIVP